MDNQTLSGLLIAAGMLSFWAYDLIAGLICGNCYFSIFMGVVLTGFVIAMGVSTRGRLGAVYFCLYMFCIYIMFSSFHQPAYKKLQALPKWSPNAEYDSEQANQ
jgi:hypothetical protein